MSINIENYGVINIGGLEIWLTETLVNTWIIMALLIVLAIVVRVRLKSFKGVPTGFQNAIEAGVEAFDKMAMNALGSKLAYLAPWFFSVFVYIFSSALVSVVGLRAPTADFATTAALALASFVIMIGAGLRHQKGNYLKGFLQPHPLFFPLNLLSELAKPVSLSFRLFGNMLAGTIILTLYYGLTPIFVQIGIPAALHAFFDVAFGAIQTYIFVIISLMYVRGAAY